VLEAEPQRAAKGVDGAWPPVGARVWPGPVPAPESDGSLVRLTSREEEVAALVARGLTNRQIAEELVVAQRTAENHVQSILNKLGLTSRVQLAVWVLGGDLRARPPRSA
jgi:DNA-binding NarL/FixJ family response regulator